MLIPVALLHRRLGIRPRGIAHVGAHLAEELDAYLRAGWGPRVWVEAQGLHAKALSEQFHSSQHDLVIQGAAWSKSGETLQLNIASNSQSSSVLAAHTHLSLHPDISFPSQESVETISLEDILIAAENAFGVRPNFVVLDVQGAELETLTGLKDWSGIDFIYAEVAQTELYQGQPQLTELDSYLRERGYCRVATALLPGLRWGVALYVPEGSAHHYRSAWQSMPRVISHCLAARHLAVSSRLLLARLWHHCKTRLQRGAARQRKVR